MLMRIIPCLSIINFDKPAIFLIFIPLYEKDRFDTYYDGLAGFLRKK